MQRKILSEIAYDNIEYDMRKGLYGGDKKIVKFRIDMRNRGLEDMILQYGSDTVYVKLHRIFGRWIDAKSGQELSFTDGKILDIVMLKCEMDFITNEDFPRVVFHTDYPEEEVNRVMKEGLKNSLETYLIRYSSMNADHNVEMKFELLYEVCVFIEDRVANLKQNTFESGCLII